MPDSPACLPRPTVSGGLLALATLLFALDHNFGERTFGAVALASAALLREAKKLSARPRRRGDPRESGTLPMPALHTPMISAKPFMS